MKVTAAGLWLAASLIFLALALPASSGDLGGWLQHNLKDLFGLLAYWLPLFVAVWGAWCWRGEGIGGHKVTAAGFGLATGGTAALLGAVPEPHGTLLAGAGGTLAAHAFVAAIGLPGLWVVAGSAGAGGAWLLGRDPVIGRAPAMAGRAAGGVVAACGRVLAAAGSWWRRQRLATRAAAVGRPAGADAKITVHMPPAPPPAVPVVAPLAPVEPPVPASRVADETAVPAAGTPEPVRRRPGDRPRIRGTAAARWTLPPASLLAGEGGGASPAVVEEFVRNQAAVIDQTLLAFKVEGRVVGATPGARIVLFEWQPAAGVKVSRLEQLQDDLALALKAERIRIVAPLPGKGTVGIEIPHPAPAGVTLGGLMAAHGSPRTAGDLPLFLGRALTGEPVIAELTQMPHMLIAGTTGSGKSVCIHTILLSLIMTRTPDQLRLLLIDPKRVEMIAYRESPHLLAEVVTDPKSAVARLRWLVAVMEARYDLLARHTCRDLQAFNRRVAEEPALRETLAAAEGNLDASAILSPSGLPWIVVGIDELADLMVAKAREVEDALQRLAQMARGVGIHLVVATQRPSVDVLTGVIKANMPSRISFQVATKVDSRTILDANGAEALLGRGDMLYAPAGSAEPSRAQGAFVSPAEVAAILAHWGAQGSPDLVPAEEALAAPDGAGGSTDAGEDDPLYGEAVQTVVRSGEASVSQLQRRLGIGFARAGRLVDLMERRGVVGPKQGSKTREILLPHGHPPAAGETSGA